MRLMFVLIATLGYAQSNDVFVMVGSDVTRPASSLKANYNIGYGHTFDALKRNPLFDEVTFAYTYENNGSGFLHSDFGAHTEAIGGMKNLALPKTKRLTGYTWAQIGITSVTGSVVENRLYTGYSLGLIIHASPRYSVWVQETVNKIITVPWYTTASVGVTFSF